MKDIYGPVSKLFTICSSLGCSSQVWVTIFRYLSQWVITMHAHSCANWPKLSTMQTSWCVFFFFFFFENYCDFFFPFTRIIFFAEFIYNIFFTSEGNMKYKFRALAFEDAKKKKKKSIFCLQTLLYLFYQLILQLTPHSNFYFYIQSNKII